MSSELLSSSKLNTDEEERSLDENIVGSTIVIERTAAA